MNYPLASGRSINLFQSAVCARQAAKNQTHTVGLKRPWNRLHFVGIGGVGMAGLAIVAAELGATVTGSDVAVSANTSHLATLGVEVEIGHASRQFDDTDAVIYSSAITEDNPELLAAREQNIRVARRGCFLAELAALFPQAISIAGSHGKTTVAAMLACIMEAAGLTPTYIVGGRLMGATPMATLGSGPYFVAEVDESDGTQSLFRSTLAVITNIDDDHCWSVGGRESLEENFVAYARNAADVITWRSTATTRLLQDLDHVRYLDDVDMAADLSLRVPGRHNLANASLAIHAALRLGIDGHRARASVQQFPGVDRRLSIRFQSDHVVLIEDYAHHPRELEAAMGTLKELYPGRRLVVAFQPHRYERVARYADPFAEQLSRADVVYVLPPFAAWMDDNHLADAREIIAKISEIPCHYVDNGGPCLAERLSTNLQSGDVVAVIGAGDIDQQVPLLIKAFQNKGW